MLKNSPNLVTLMGSNLNVIKFVPTVKMKIS